MLIPMKKYSNKNLIIYLTEKCNLSCKYCFVEKKNRRLDFKDYINVIEKYKNEISNITFFGGEPLLCFDLIKKIIEYNKNKKYFFNYILNTNGLMLSDEILNFIIKNNILVNLSLDGIDISNNLNRGNTFDDVFDKVLKLREKNIKFIINYVISPNNICYFYDSISFFRKEKIDKVCLMINYDAKWDISDILLFKEELNKCLLIILNDGKLMKIYPVYNKLSALLKNESVKKCNFGDDSIILSTTGKIYPCMSFYNDNNYEINEEHKTFDNNVPIDKCKGCEYEKFCVNNCMCRCRSISLSNNFDINCEFEKIFIDFSNLMIDKMFDDNNF